MKPIGVSIANAGPLRTLDRIVAANGHRSREIQYLKVSEEREGNALHIDQQAGGFHNGRKMGSNFEGGNPVSCTLIITD